MGIVPRVCDAAQLAHRLTAVDLLWAGFSETRRMSTLNVDQRMPDVHLQHLALHLDCPDEHPDLILAEGLWVRSSQLFELLQQGPVPALNRAAQQGLLERLDDQTLNGHWNLKPSREVALRTQSLYKTSILCVAAYTVIRELTKRAFG